MKVTVELVEFIKGWETCKLVPYKDSGGKWTAGWGCLLRPDEDPDALWTQEKADARFAEELEAKEAAVVGMMPAWLLRQHEFDSLVSFAYNKGTEALRTSTLLAKVKAGHMMAAAAEFTKWNRSSGKLDFGVLRRSCGEQAIFLAADYSRRP